MWVFVLIITGLKEAEESRNEDLDFEEKNKWKFIKSQQSNCTVWSELFSASSVYLLLFIEKNGRKITKMETRIQ